MLRRSCDLTNAIHISRYQIYCQTSKTGRTESQNLKVFRLVLQLSLPNPLKPGVKSRMKMQLEQRRQAYIQYETCLPPYAPPSSKSVYVYFAVWPLGLWFYQSSAMALNIWGHGNIPRACSSLHWLVRVWIWPVYLGCTVSLVYCNITCMQRNVLNHDE